MNNEENTTAGQDSSASEAPAESATTAPEAGADSSAVGGVEGQTTAPEEEAAPETAPDSAAE